MKRVYLDNAATTQVDLQVLAVMRPYFNVKFGNASEPHLWGQEARLGLDQARDQMAKFLGCKPGEIIFTSCATESINLSHKGLVEALASQSKKQIITTAIEHKAVLETCQHLEKLGRVKTTYLPVDRYGQVKVADVKKAIKPETILISIMYVNNEVGTIQPIAEIGKLVKEINKKRKQKIFFHTDATQAIQYLNCRVDQLGVDLLSLTGHKLYAPKGIGALYIREGTPLVRQQDGGGQEFNQRAGTENIPYIVGLGEAVKRVNQSGRVGQAVKIKKLRDKLVKGVLRISGVKLTGHPIKRAPQIASFVIKGVEGESVLLYLSEQGIATASGSACTSGLLKPSHVLTAMGIPAELSHGSLRLSLGKFNTQKDIDIVLKILPEIIKKLRQMAPK